LRATTAVALVLLALNPHDNLPAALALLRRAAINDAKDSNSAFLIRNEA
jgi:hypothetical protein